MSDAPPRSSPPPGSSSISPIPICASSRSATSATTRPIARGISRARCGSTGRRRAGTKRDRDFVTPAAMAKLFGSIGIGPQTTVVLYGDPVQFGSYAYWAFTMAGHAKLKLLDGGRRKWVMEKRPLSRDVPHFPAVAYPPPVGTVDDAGRPRRCARASARAAAAAHRPAFAGGIFGRARLRLFLRRRSRRRADRAHPRRRASLFQGPAERGQFVQVAGATSRHAGRAPASRRKNSTISSAIAG